MAVACMFTFTQMMPFQKSDGRRYYFKDITNVEGEFRVSLDPADTIEVRMSRV